MHCLSTLGVVALTATALTAQTDRIVGGLGANGCQNADNPPTLTNSLPASGLATFDYDPATGVLTLTVENTSMVFPGDANPLITEVLFNVPTDAVTSASLISAVGNGGATPMFALSFDADRSDALGEIRGNCFGNFSVSIDSTLPGLRGGIANANADTFGGPAGQAVVGPVVFSIQLTGPGTGTISADAIADSFSDSHVPTSIAMDFQGGGPTGDESGTLGAVDDVCRTALYLTGPAAIGTAPDLCVTGSPGCHACWWLSLTPGPVDVAGIMLPIGLPVLASFDLVAIPNSGMLCINLPIPDSPALVGLELFFTNATHPPGDPMAFSFSPAFSFTITN